MIRKQMRAVAKVSNHYQVMVFSAVVSSFFDLVGAPLLWSAVFYATTLLIALRWLAIPALANNITEEELTIRTAKVIMMAFAVLAMRII